VPEGQKAYSMTKTKGIAEWLVERLAEDTPTLVGTETSRSTTAPVY
jgi:hypothetical protein